ncbi:hypothetical protein PTKIN_Ptkin01aG0370800 [Pterospermum kingtungense]
MPELFLFNIAASVLEKIAPLAVEEVSLAFHVKSDLKRLQETVRSIQAVLLDAERQQHHNEKLRLCMWKLRDIFYDAEDVIDEFECEALRKKVANHPSISLKVRRLASFSFPLSFSLKMGHKIREINRRLDELATEWNSFNLGQGGDNRHVINRVRESYSSVNSSDVIGRDVDKENLINLLMKPSELEPVIPIVGIGGLGKTTLAQLVYNDDRVTRVFPLKIWVCVSEEFNLTRLLKLIIHSITKEDKYDDSSTIEALQNCLRSLLNDKRCLLVLDDVWNEDRVRWIELRNLLMPMVDSQSRIIVTTRSLKVASIMSSIPPYELNGLPHKDCLTLFAKWAFNDGDHERRHPNLMRIGEEIVKKCRGVPLAVRTLGSLLFSKTDESDWNSVRDNEIWRLEQSENDILPVLKLSYNHLPSHLQRCLAFLSLYKKDEIYFRDDVIQLWMANGLLEHSNRKQEYWEDVGSRYLKELRSRCLIQEVMYDGFYFTFKMHDLIHDLALDVLQKELKTVDCQTVSVDTRIRLLLICDDKPLKIPQILKKLKHVRTVIIQEVSKDSILGCISYFKYLRALNLSNSSLEALPYSIGGLKHLRFLDLSYCRSIRKLPSSFCKLRSLLTLKMRGTPLMQLPDSMQSLIELRHLEITIEAKNLAEIRPGCWSCLQYLCLFGCDNLECLYEGMQHLTSLRSLFLVRCYKLISLSRSLKLLTKLEDLRILQCRAINLQMEPEEEEHHQDVHFRLKTFSIKWSDALTDLPRLLFEGSSTTLQHIIIHACYKFEVLPEWLKNLTSLQKLEIKYCSRLSALPEGMDRLTELRRLKIEGCPTLTKRCRRDGGPDWRKIAHVQEVDIK